MNKCENCDQAHWACCIKPTLGAVLWFGAALALIAAWLTRTTGTGLFLGLDEVHWYFDSFALALLALGAKMHCGNACSICGTRS
mgnify:FL=1